MGTDIHMSIYTREGPDAPWVYKTNADLDRQYRVFAVLAGVRNGTGFAGCKIGEPVTPIAEPRGIPDDLQVSYYALLEALGGDAQDLHEQGFAEMGAFFGHVHTPSWLTLDEVLSYDWDQTVVTSGVVTAAEFRKFQKNGRPDSFCGDVSGWDLVKVPADDMERRCRENDWTWTDEDRRAALLRVVDSDSAWADLRRVPAAGSKGLTFYTRVEWGEPLRQEVRDFLEWACALPGDLQCAPENIRLVFGFD